MFHWILCSGGDCPVTSDQRLKTVLKYFSDQTTAHIFETHLRLTRFPDFRGGETVYFMVPGPYRSPQIRVMFNNLKLNVVCGWFLRFLYFHVKITPVCRVNLGNPGLLCFPPPTTLSLGTASPQRPLPPPLLFFPLLLLSQICLRQWRERQVNSPMVHIHVSLHIQYLPRSPVLYVCVVRSCLFCTRVYLHYVIRNEKWTCN